MNIRHFWKFLPLVLGGPALAGGTETAPATHQLSRDAALRGLPGVTVTEEPTGDFETDSARWMTGVGYTHALRVPVGRTFQRVLVSATASENSSTVNGLLVYVETLTASTAQRQAMVAVARGFLEACVPGLTPQARSIWAGLSGHEWQGVPGWQDRQLGQVRVGWSGRDGLNVADQEVTGMSLEWPGDMGRCVF